MSLNTSQVIHIVTEMIALLSITAYFMNENKKLTGKLNSLSEKVEEQDEKLQKHEKVLFDILRQMESSKVQNVVMTPSPSPASSGISYKPICITTSSGNQVCTPSFGLEKVDEEDEEEEEEEEEAQEEEYLNVILVAPPVVSLPPPPLPSESKVEEIIEEEEVLPPPIFLKSESPPPPLPSSSEKKKRKRNNKKKTTQTSSVTDIDKELENELNELFKEEILSSH